MVLSVIPEEKTPSGPVLLAPTVPFGTRFSPSDDNGSDTDRLPAGHRTLLQLATDTVGIIKAERSSYLIWGDWRAGSGNGSTPTG